MEGIATLAGSTDPEAAAAGLIDEFGSFEAALAGSRQRQLDAASGDKGAVDALRLFRHAMRHALATRAVRRPLIHNWIALLDYLRGEIASLDVEVLRVLHLNSRNRLIRDELNQVGTIDHVTVHTREVIKRALEVGSAAIILVHNHPSGDPTPSASDVALTLNLSQTAAAVGIALYDHIIIGSWGHYSFRSAGHF